VTNNPVDAGTSIIQVIIGKDDENSIFSLLSLDKYCIASEELQRLHSVVR
jgi:malate/lactate dehydrogenase